MKLTFDLDGATSFELNAVSKFFAELAKGQGYYTDDDTPSGEEIAKSKGIETLGAPRKDKPITKTEKKTTVKAGDLEHTTVETSSHEQLAADGAGLLDDDGVDIEDITQSEIDAGNLPNDDGELDTRNFPWDKRIHSKNKSKNDDGTWRYARKPKNFETKEQWNIYIEQIEEELKPSDDVPPPADDIDLEANDVFGQSEVPPPVEDDVPPPSTDDYPEKTFGELMSLITSNQKNDSVQKINEVLTEMNITSTGNSALPVLKSDHPERISEAYAKLEGKL